MTREQRLAIRKVLFESKEPLFLTAIAAKAGVDLTNPHRQQATAQFVESYLCETSKEAALAFETG